MAFRYEQKSSDMLKKLMGSKLEDFTVKGYILDPYGSIKALKKQAAQAGNWQAKADLSMVYKEGIPELNIEKDLDKARGWLESSIEDGNPMALHFCDLGSLYDIKGTVPFQRKAHEMYHKAARLGCVQAELNLAESYRCGVEGVVDKDLEEAFTWYKIAAGEETLDSKLCGVEEMMRGTLKTLGVDTKVKALGYLHRYYMAGECPEGKSQPLKALYYLKKAAETGHAESQTKLGLTYLSGLNELPKDLDQAKRWLKKAANNNSSEAKEVLEKLGQPGVIEQVPTTKIPSDNQALDNLKQFCDIFKGKAEEHNMTHPFVIKNPLMYHESMFSQYPESPTAQLYLKAFKLAKEGMSKLQEGNFKEAIKFFAHSYLYENTILGSLLKRQMPNFLPNIVTGILQELQDDEEFFEGLLVLYALCPMHSEESSKVNFKNFKGDMQQKMFVKNVIHLIKKNESSQLPTEDPYTFESNYCSWLHVLYYLLGSCYTIAEQYDDGAQAFQKALQCCPTYFEAKAGLGYCLMSLGCEVKREKERDFFDLDGQQDQLHVDLNQPVHENSYLRWSQEALKRKSKQVFMEYLQEAPVCDKKYPNCNYHLALLYMYDRNLQKAREWKSKGEDAEEKRLPFVGPVSAGTKQLLICLDMLPIPTHSSGHHSIPKYLCSYDECSNKNVQKLRSCPCKQVSYCGRDCQKKHWKEHKKTCSSKSNM